MLLGKFSEKLVLVAPLIFGVFFQTFCMANGENVYAELESLTPEQRKALAEFKDLMSPILPQEYMREDIYLVKFMKFNNFNLEYAEEHMKEMLRWRGENKIDQELKNPSDYFEELQKDYPVYVDGFDKEERPICEVPFGAWKVRTAASAGLLKKLVMHMFINCFEKAVVKVREQQALGKNVTQWVFIGNLEGYNPTEHACPSCLPLSLNLATGTEQFYPLSTHGFWLINTPDSFATLFGLLKPVSSRATRLATKVFGSNEADWKPFLEKRVDLDQISTWYGGAKERNSV